MSVPVLDVDLDQPPEARWEGLVRHADAARELIAFYNRDLGSVGQFGELLTTYRDAVVERAYLAELAAVARILDVPDTDVLLANLYYDALKVVLGCTAFAIDTPDGPIHARNLDWPSEERLLARHTIIVRYRRRGAHAFDVIGWPGYIGALSGVRPGAFAVSLNAVLSDDAPAFGPPVTRLLRSVLAETADFAAAVDRLTRAPIASDCLLLVTGTEPGEAVVIERGPSRAAVRTAAPLVVTNDYRVLPTTTQRASELAATSCGRFDRAAQLVRERPPRSLDDCFDVLLDPGVRMGITMQSMAFHPRTGALVVRS